MEFKGSQFALNDIKAKFGKTGTVQGKLSVDFSGKGSPAFLADLEGNNLDVTGKSSATYMDTPADYQGVLHFKGKNILWEGQHLSAVDISTTFTDKDWTIKPALISLPGNSQVKLAGTIMPKANSAAYTSFQVTTDDLGKMVDSFAPADTNIFSALGGAGPFKKLQFAGNLEISPAKISFFNIDATIEDKEKVTGVLNIDRLATKKNVTAKLHLANWDSAAFPDGFVQAVIKSDADIELTADNFTRNGLKITDLSFKGKTDEKGISIQDLSGHLSDKDSFSLSGHVATLAPVSGLDVSYTLKAAHAVDVAKNLGVDLPSLAAENFDLKGNIKQDAAKYNFTAQGNGDDLVWQGQHIQHPVLTLDASPSGIKISGLTGTMWNGKLTGDIAFTEQVQPAPSWSSTFKASLKQADLQKPQGFFSFKNITIGASDVDFDLISADSTPNSATGSVNVHASSLTLEKFNADKLNDALHQLTARPDNLQQLVDDSFHKNGSTVFKDAQLHIKLDHGKGSIDTFNLSNATEKMTLTASVDFPAGAYAVSGDLQLAKPEGFPLLKVQRAIDGTDYKVDSKPLEAYVIKNLPPPPAATLPPDNLTTPPAAVQKPAVAPVPAPPAAAATPNKDQPINDILKRLDDTDSAAPSVQPKPAQPPVPVAPPQPDVNKMMQQMQMQELMQQQNNGLPTPLTP